MRRKSLARVVLPEPDSPTMPSVSPSATCTLTPSSALTHARALRTENPLYTGKYFFSPTASSFTSGVRSRRGRGPAARHVAARHGHGGRERLVTDGLALRTPWSEGTSLGQLCEVRWLPADLDQLLALEVDVRQTSQQRACVGVARLVEDLHRAAHLDDPAGVHH